MSANRWLLVILATVLLIGGFRVWQGRYHIAAGKGALVVREEVVKALEREGLRITETAPTNRYALFGLQPGASVGVWTDQGTLDVTFFPKDVAEKLIVEETGEHQWLIRGWTGEPREIGSNRPQYFIIHRNLFVMTDNPELASVVTRALGAK